MTNLTRTITWIDRSVQEAPKDGKDFTATMDGEAYFNVFWGRIEEGFLDDSEPFRFVTYDVFGHKFHFKDFTHWTRDRITP